MKPNPIVILVAILGGGWLFLQLFAGAATLLSVGLGSGPEFAVIGGFFLAVVLACIAIFKPNKGP